jgi:hypothetical protein
MTGGGGGPDGDSSAVTVSLVGLRGPRVDARTASAQSMQDLFLKIRAAQDGLAAQDQYKRHAQGDLDELFGPVTTASVKGGGQANQDKGGAGADAQAPQVQPAQKRGRADASLRTGTGASSSAGDLWGQIKPCWDQLPSVSTVPVTLEVTIDSQGMVTTPPKIVRGSGTPDERRLVSEARALAAIAACVPYRGDGSASLGGKFKVEFAAR